MFLFTVSSSARLFCSGLHFPY